ncbi:hypothetical protein [Gelidibacter japonicus]|uniref:hypothetical protein n=1 Tax=Gelidibacter japonicus TaxID=1962232 RepID=UPI0013CFB7AD|nr:hypothetical protein [Gelidibacter japonicus]
MKNILSLIFLQLLFGTLLSAQNTPLPDANFEAFLIAQSVLRPNIRPEQLDTTVLGVADNILEVAIVQFNKQFKD